MTNEVGASKKVKFFIFQLAINTVKKEKSQNKISKHRRFFLIFQP